MTPDDLIEDCRQRYNAVGDAFFADAELYDLLFDASMELATETECIESTDTSITTADGTRSYSYPSNVYKIHRIEYNGVRLDPTDFLEDDFYTGNDADTTNKGDPRYYQIWNDTIYLRPVPDAAQTVTLYTIEFPIAVSSGSTLSIPERYHPYLKDYLLSAMFSKDGNERLAVYHRNLWASSVIKVKRVEMKRKISDQYKVTKVQEQLPLHDVEHF